LIKILQVRNIDSFVESRRQKNSEKDRKTVQAILNDIKRNGDSAVKKYERKFNGTKTSQLRVSAKEIKEARSKISRDECDALRSMSSILTWEEAHLLGGLSSPRKSGGINQLRYHLCQFQVWVATFRVVKQDILVQQSCP